MRKIVLLFFMFSLTFLGFANDSAVLDFTAYKNQEFVTDGNINIIVNDFLRQKYANMASEVKGVETESVTIYPEEFDKDIRAFRISLYSNIGNKVKVYVSISDFVNSKFPNNKLSVNASSPKGNRVTTPIKTGYIYDAENSISKYEYIIASNIINDLNFEVYFMYRTASGSTKEEVDANLSSAEYKVYTEPNVLKYLTTNDSFKYYYDSFNYYYDYYISINKDEYDALPEGIEFTSNIVVNIEVES